MNARKLLLTTAVLLAGVATASAQQKLLIGSTSSSSSQYGYFVAVSQLINAQVQGVESSVVETGATVDNLRRLDRKQIDLGLVTTNTGYQAYAGVEGFKDKPVAVRLLWVYTNAPQNVIVRKDAGVTKLADLAGKKFNPGLRGSATEKTSEAVFNLLGIKVDAARGSTSDIVDAIKDNRVVGYVKSGAGTKLDGSTLDIATFTPIQVLSLTPEQAAKIEKEMPDLGRFEISGLEGDKGAFKTPTLREIARTAPYMHDGSQATLEEVIEHYNKGGTPNPQLDEGIFELNLTPEEKADLITFLKEGLSSDSYPEHEPPELPE